MYNAIADRIEGRNRFASIVGDFSSPFNNSWINSTKQNKKGNEIEDLDNNSSEHVLRKYAQSSLWKKAYTGPQNTSQ